VRLACPDGEATFYLTRRGRLGARFKRCAGSHYADAQEAFNHGYRIHLKHLKEEIIRRKERFPAIKLINEFLTVEDADFIDVYKKS
jgi:hypothetical protein